MPLYRQRLRSHAGCSSCRKRHRKCDEQKPICGDCKRLGLRCPYLVDVLASQSQLGPPAIFSTDREATGGSNEVVTTVSPVVQPSAAAGYSEDIHSVLQYYQIHPTQLSQRAESRIFSSFLGILPAASSQPMLLAAVTTILTIFMPGDWGARSAVILRLSSSAIRGIVHATVTTQFSETMDCTILSAILLHLCDVHTYPQPAQRWLHLRGAHELLRRRLSMNVSPSIFLVKSIQPLIYHEVISSTINHKLLVDGISPSYIDQVSKFCAINTGGNILGIKYLGVPATCLSALLKLACLRNEILRDDISFTTIQEVTDSKDVLCQIPFSPAEGIARTIEVLHVYACLFFRQMLLGNTGLTSDEHETMAFPEQNDEVFQKALSSICSYKFPPHVATWPLLIIGLAIQDATLRIQVRECMEQLVHDSRLASVRGVLKTLDRAWADGAGLSVLLSEDLSETLIF